MFSTKYFTIKLIAKLQQPGLARLITLLLYSTPSLFVWRECLAHQVPIVLTVLSFRFSGLCLMVVNATIHFHGQASPVGVWSFLRLPLNPSRGKKEKKKKKKRKHFCEILAKCWQNVHKTN